MSAPQRPILPKPAHTAVLPGGEGGSSGGGPPGRIPFQLPRPRKNIKAACETCRKSKVKYAKPSAAEVEYAPVGAVASPLTRTCILHRCTGERPFCSRCEIKGLECVYLTDLAETQIQALKRKHDESQQENSVYKELYRLLVTVTESEALDILQRLRSGTDVETAVRLAQEGDLLLQLALKPESRFRYQFPYLPFMPAPLQTSDNPYLESLLYEGALQGSAQPPPDHQQNQQRQQSATAPTGESSRPVGPGPGPSPGYSHVFLKPYHTAELVDGRLATVRASDWTSVTTDDNLFRRLLRTYLVHEYCVAPAFQKDYFLYDLARGKGHLCSSLLVNAVMAVGSHCHQGNTLRSQLWNPHNIGYRFLVEARRLWELEDLDNCKLTTLQATILLSLAYNSHGMVCLPSLCSSELRHKFNNVRLLKHLLPPDKIGDIFIRHAVSMASKIRLFSASPAHKSSRTQRAREFTAWAFFNFQTSAGYYFMRRAAWPGPPPEVAPPDPELDPGWYGEFALVYPSSPAPPAPMYWPHTFWAMCALRVIMNQVADEAFRDHHPRGVAGLPRRTALELQARLAEWYAALPAPLQPRMAVLPNHLRLHLEYFAIHFTLATTVIEEQDEIHSSTDLERPNTTATSNEDEIDGIDGISSTSSFPLVSRMGPPAMRNLETVARLYYTRHGFEGCDSSLAHTLSLLAGISLRALEGGGGDGARLAAGRGWPEVLRSTLVLAMRGLHEQGRHMHVCRVLFRLLADRMRPAERDILGRFVVSSGEGGGLFGGDGGGDGGGSEGRAAAEADLALHTRSRFPVPVVKMGEDLNAAILENLVQKYQAVSIDSSDSGGSGNSDGDVTMA